MRNLWEIRGLGEIIAQKKHGFHLKNIAEGILLLARDCKKAAIDKTICVFDYDLQKILSTPKDTMGPIYYMSKLNIWKI